MSYSIQVDFVERRESDKQWIREIAQLFRNSIGTTIIADVQGFIVNNQFIPKELCYTCDGLTTRTVTFKSTAKFRELNLKDRKQTQWLQHNHHGLMYNSGEAPLEELGKIIPECVINIIVKGSQKSTFFKQVFPMCNIIDLENDQNCVILEKTLHNCKNHFVDKCLCSKVNVVTLVNYLNNI